MMKSLLINVSMVLLLMVSFTIVAAADEDVSYRDFPSLYDDTEYVSVDDAVRKGYLSTAAEAVNPYKLYSVNREQFFMLKNQPEKVIDKLLEYVWLLPLSDGTNRRVWVKDDRVEVLGGRTASLNQSQEDIDMDTCFRELSAYLRENGTNFGEIRLYALEVPEFYSSFLLCEMADGAIVIPFSDATHLTNLENGKIYPAEEAADILKRAFSSGDSGEMTANGGASVGTGRKALYLIPVIGAAVLAVTAAAGLIHRSRVRHRYMD